MSEIPIPCSSTNETFQEKMNTYILYMYMYVYLETHKHACTCTCTVYSMYLVYIFKRLLLNRTIAEPICFVLNASQNSFMHMYCTCTKMIYYIAAVATLLPNTALHHSCTDAPNIAIMSLLIVDYTLNPHSPPHTHTHTHTPDFHSMQHSNPLHGNYLKRPNTPLNHNHMYMYNQDGHGDATQEAH